MRALQVRSTAFDGLAEIGRMALSVVRALLLGLLSLIEPVIVWICSAISAGAVLMALFYRLAAPAGHFPYAVVLGIGLGSLAVLGCYYGMMACLSED